MEPALKGTNALEEDGGRVVVIETPYEARAKAPPKASSFDRVVEDTLRAQIKR